MKPENVARCINALLVAMDEPQVERALPVALFSVRKNWNSEDIQRADEFARDFVVNSQDTLEMFVEGDEADVKIFLEDQKNHPGSRILDSILNHVFESF